MWWRKSRPEKPIHEQLIEARDTLQRQIEIMQVGPIRQEIGGGAYYDSRVAALSAELSEIEASLANLGLGGAQGT